MVVGDDPAGAVLEFSRGVNATQIVIGASRRSRLNGLFTRGVGAAIVDGSGDIDVYVVTHAAAHGGFLLRPGTLGGRPSLLGARRRAVAWFIAVAGPLALTAVLANTREMHSLPIDLLLFL